MNIYQYEGVFYTKLGEGRMKHPVTREWVPAVIYTQTGQNEVFIREKTEFYERFKPYR